MNTFEALEARRLLFAGAIDTTFGTGGTVSVNIPFVNYTGDAEAVDTQGRMALLGRASTQDPAATKAIVIRLTPDGALDSTFGNSGISTFGDAEPTQLAVDDTNGRVAVVLTDNGKSELHVLNNDGSSGFSPASFPTLNDDADLDVAWDGGKLVATWKSPSDSTEVDVARYTSNGALDNTFYSDGTTAVSIGHAITRLAIDASDGYTIVGATDGLSNPQNLESGDLSYLLRFDGTNNASVANGQSDASGADVVAVGAGNLLTTSGAEHVTQYDRQGHQVTQNNIGPIVTSIVPSSDGSALLISSQAGLTGIMRLTSDGAMDPAYGDFGGVTSSGLTFGAPDGTARVLSVDPDNTGKLSITKLQAGASRSAEPGSATLSHKKLTVTGTDGADLISIYLGKHDGQDRIFVQSNTFGREVPIPEVKKIDVLAGDGDDEIRIGDGIIGVWIDAGSGNDTVSGGPGNDVIYGRTGNDYLLGNGGNDIIYGEGGRDSINGGGGKDTLFGDNNNDTLNGAGGNDQLFGGASSSDRIIGGAGTDAAAQDDKDSYSSIETLLM